MTTGSVVKPKDEMKHNGDYLYNAHAKSNRETPIGYLNIQSIRARHIVPENTNAVDTIVALTPTGVARG